MEQQRGLVGGRGGGACTAVGCVLTGLLGTSAHNDFQEAGVCVCVHVEVVLMVVGGGRCGGWGCGSARTVKLPSDCCWLRWIGVLLQHKTRPTRLHRSSSKSHLIANEPLVLVAFYDL